MQAREGVKIEHEKKLSTLQTQEYRGKEDAKLDKTKASIKKLQPLIIVTSQAVTTTTSAINKVRDDELAPQLVELCYGYDILLVHFCYLNSSLLCCQKKKKKRKREQLSFESAKISSAQFHLKQFSPRGLFGIAI